MKAIVLDLNGKTSGEVEVPAVFSTQLRPDLVKRMFWLVGSHHLQPKGRDPMAGERTTAETHNPPTGTGQSRIPRVKGERYSKSGLAAGVASVVKGRLPHPPRSEKVIHLGVNKKENRLATNSAIAFTANVDAVKARGHRVAKISLPMVVADDIETVEKTVELVSFLEKVELKDELQRVDSHVKRNSGKRRLRGRAYRTRVGPLIVVTNDRGVGKAAGGIPGVGVTRVESLSVLDLAPGGVPGRLTIWTESALSALGSKVKGVGS
ncbi:MAG: 50S ribosomal protein L4 [Nitrososphaerota archaeon]|jgi:large subunit ribosomal protein L4e|nr:50S ribosomal protein L4 [Nitrososphaerota archaeon]MDG6955711.1 50S ribosomal protein L4 [Nitrososphaerota archaeon]MDG6957938.1 50S ribosomal protein L4 [Nitrososphaerota archaeon]MDG6960056.1 50S ribosomal protein L4 [Nitrososphaerota archaeon]MDG6965074.1 50S ribosomal protein L4 [Nitrososphaerota archaeon]